jgi:hypothetical protein
VIRGDKGKSMGIIEKDNLRQKVQEFITNNNFTEMATDPTNKFQKILRESHNQYNHVIHKSSIKTLTTHKPTAPRLQAKIKTHKDHYPIRPVVNSINAPSHNTAKLLKRKLTELLQLAITYNIPNSIQLAKYVVELKTDTYHKRVTFDIKDLFTNIPIRETIQTAKRLLKHNLDSTITQYINLLRIALTQNYFVYDNKYYTCNKAVAMESPLSNIIAEIFLQHYEGLFIKHWTDSNIIMYYTRYVDDIFIVFHTRRITENRILEYMNSINKHLEFKMTTTGSITLTSPS